MTTRQTVDDSPTAGAGDTATSSLAPERNAADRTPPGPVLTPAAARTPLAPAPASYTGALISLLLVAAGVVGIRDGLVAAGALRGSLWTTDTVNWIDGLRFDYWMLPAGVVAIIVGVVLVLVALAPRRRTTTAMSGRTSVVISHRDVGRLAASVAQTVPGVTDARATSKRRTVTVIARTTGQDAAAVKAAIAATVGDALGALSKPPKIVVRTRTGSHS
jgi:hypothetical protein